MNKITISGIRITPVLPNKSLVAFCSFLVNESLFVSDVALHRSPGHSEGYRLVFPDKTLFNGKRVNVIYPVNRETELYLTREIKHEYESQLERIQKSELKYSDKGVNYERVQERKY